MSDAWRGFSVWCRGIRRRPSVDLVWISSGGRVCADQSNTPSSSPRGCVSVSEASCAGTQPQCRCEGSGAFVAHTRHSAQPWQEGGAQGPQGSTMEGGHASRCPRTVLSSPMAGQNPFPSGPVLGRALSWPHRATALAGTGDLEPSPRWVVGRVGRS